MSKDVKEVMNGDEHLNSKELKNKDNGDLGQNESLKVDTEEIQNE